MDCLKMKHAGKRLRRRDVTDQCKWKEKDQEQQLTLLDVGKQLLEKVAELDSVVNRRYMHL